MGTFTSLRRTAFSVIPVAALSLSLAACGDPDDAAARRRFAPASAGGRAGTLRKAARAEDTVSYSLRRAGRATRRGFPAKRIASRSPASGWPARPDQRDHAEAEAKSPFAVFVASPDPVANPCRKQGSLATFPPTCRHSRTGRRITGSRTRTCIRPHGAARVYNTDDGAHGRGAADLGAPARSEVEGRDPLRQTGRSSNLLATANSGTTSSPRVPLRFGQQDSSLMNSAVPSPHRLPRREEARGAGTPWRDASSRTAARDRGEGA